MTDLKLLALDRDDLAIVSAHVQDAVVRVGDMGFARADRRFALLMNRYAWEAEGKSGPRHGSRKRAALHFNDVTAVAASGIDLDKKDGMLDLLAVDFTETEAPAGEVTLNFAGGGAIRLAVDCLEARLMDLGAAWAAKARPSHALDE